MRLMLLLLLAAPLGAQQTVVVPDVNVPITVSPTPFVNNINVMTDSAMIANLNENLRLLREDIAAGECNTCGGANTTTKVAVAILLPVLVWIAWELRGIKNNSERSGGVGAQGVGGINGVDGQDGADGTDGADGADGQDGAPGADGQDGVDGQDGDNYGESGK